MPQTTPGDAAQLARLGQGMSRETACAAGNMDASAFPAWWQQQLTQRLPQLDGEQRAPVMDAVTIQRDPRGVPHIHARHDADLYFAYGYAMAQDRLWQLDYYRRQAQGRLSEILGAEAQPMATGGALSALDRDIVARTIGFQRIAQAQWRVLEPQVRQRLEAFATGINQVRAESLDNLPIEFALLDYVPDPWHPADALAVWIEFQYYLTVRLPVIIMPEIARHVLGDGDLYQAYLQGEADDESILPPGVTMPLQGAPVGQTVGDPEDSVGSNNWVVAGQRTASGHPLLASDPHIAFNAISCWYEVHLMDDAGLNVAGAGYIGVPGVIFGRNLDVAWGVTNNICSQRDLYRERTDPEHPDRFWHDGQWVKARTLTETIEVKDGDSRKLTVTFSPNGPIVDHLLPAVARSLGPVSLKWMGATLGPSGESRRGGEIGAMMQTNRARNCHEFRQALQDWRVPTFSLVFADNQGHIGYQCTGRIPLRSQWHRGFREGWSADDAWQGVIPLAGMPALDDPEPGWIRTANNRTAHDDFPFPLSGTWATGYRARRIRQILEDNPQMTREACAQLQMDTLSCRAEECLPRLQTMLEDVQEARIQDSLTLWADWNRRMDPDTVGSTLFETFFYRWQQAVAAARFPAEIASYVVDSVAGLAVSLLQADPAGWFAPGQRKATVIQALQETWDKLAADLGPDPADWQWGRVHKIRLHHPLTYLPIGREMLDQGGQAVGGSGITVCNTGMDPTYMATIGANYRLVTELDAKAPVLYATDAAGQSGHPGSPHYCDQLSSWLEGQLYALPLAPSASGQTAQSRLVLKPSPA